MTAIVKKENMDLLDGKAENDDEATVMDSADNGE